MQIRQIQVAHDRSEDRLTLRVSTQADEEYRVFITRRLLCELWPHLAPLVARPQAVPETPDNTAAKTDSSPSFDKPFVEEKAVYPLGMRPLLATEVSVTTLQDGSFQFIFKEGRERIFRVSLPAELMQAVCAMLRASSEAAQWGLTLDYDVATEATPNLPDISTPAADDLSLLAGKRKRSMLH